MVTNYLFLCLFVISACIITSTVARHAIVGGDLAKSDEFPYQVSLQVDNEHICGGGILSEKFILTAAHCVVKPDGSFYNDRLFVLAGTNNLHKHVEPDQYVRVKVVYVPSEFSPTIPNKIGDMAVLELQQALEVARSGGMQRLKLPANQRENYAGQIATIAGFGWYRTDAHNHTGDGGNGDTRLRFAETRVLTNQMCKEMLRYETRNVTELHICAKVKQRPQKKQSGVCNGDGGGPLVADDNRTVIGVLNESSINCDEKEYPGLYTRVAHYLTFIYNAMKSKTNKGMRSHELPN